MLAEVHAGEGPLDTTGGGTGQYHIYTYQMEKMERIWCSICLVQAFRPSKSLLDGTA